MANIPNDPIMLLSFINMQLRDNYPDIDELCASLSIERKEIDEKLGAAGFRYEEQNNQYIQAD